MYIINAHFEDLHQASLGGFLGEIGVYILWSAGAVARPSYIGEGYVLDRISKHLRDEDKPFSAQKVLEGRVAIFRGGPERQRKTDAEVLEHTLLVAAERLGISPRHNMNSGKLDAVHRRGTKDKTIRVNLTGAHPLRLNTNIRGTAQISWRCNDSDGWVIESLPWRRAA